MEVIDTASAATVPRETSKNLSSFVSTFINEEKEKSKRKLNLIIHNVVESTKEDGAARKREDISCISDILQQFLGITVKIEKAFCLGQRKEKPRLLKITVNSEEEKALILRNCTKL